MLTIDRRTLTVALGCWLATMVALGMHLDDPWWSAITAYRISSPDQRAQFSLAFNRLFGTVAGCAIGYVIAVNIEDIPLLQAFVMFVAALLGFYMRFTSRYAYAWLLGAVMVVVLVAQSFEDVEGLWSWAYNRSFEIAVGVIVMMLVDLSLSPWRTAGPAAPTPAPTDEERQEIMTASLVGGFSVVIIPLVWTTFLLPSGVQILVTSMAMLERDFARTFRRGLLRAGGCLSGGALGLAIVGLSIDSFWIWSLFLFAGLMLVAQLHLSNSPNAYLGTQAGYGFIMAMVTGPGPPDTIMGAVDRIAGVTLGVLIMAGIYLMVESLRRYGGAHGGREGP